MGLPSFHVAVHLIFEEVVGGVEVPDPFGPVVCGWHKVWLTLRSPVDAFLRLHLQGSERVIGENRVSSLQSRSLSGLAVTFNPPLQGYDPLFFESNFGSCDSFQVLVRW